MSEIAIATIPIQDWEQPRESSEALKSGGIFPSLTKPFYVEEEVPLSPPAPMDERETLLRKIQQVTFTLYDVTLFLDTHPGQQEGLALRQQCIQERKQLLKQYADNYAPLTMDCEGNLLAEPIAWEGGTY